MRCAIDLPTFAEVLCADACLAWGSIRTSEIKTIIKPLRSNQRRRKAKQGGPADCSGTRMRRPKIKPHNNAGYTRPSRTAPLAKLTKNFMEL